MPNEQSDAKEDGSTNPKPCKHKFNELGIIKASKLRHTIYVFYCENCALVVQKIADYSDIQEEEATAPPVVEPPKPKEPGVTYG